jgi:hypothetical protein
MILQCSGKTDWFKVTAISFCTVILLCTLGGRSSTGTIVLAEGITRPDSAEQTSRPDNTGDEDFDFYSIASSILEVILVCADSLHLT